MSRALIVLDSPHARAKAAAWIGKVPTGTRVEFKATKRSMSQNSRMWAMLTEIADQIPWHGVKLRPDDWKLIFLDALKRAHRVVPNLDGPGFVNIGRSSSDLSVAEMSDLMEVMTEFGLRNGVAFSGLDESRRDAA